MTFAAAMFEPAVAYAHHSAAPYDLTREVVFEGTVTKLEWQNPHVLFTLETRSADGSAVQQEIEVAGLSLVRAWGLPRDAIAPGEDVVVRAWPARRGPQARALGVDVKTVDGRTYPLNLQASSYSFRPSIAAPVNGLAGQWVPTVQSFNGMFEFVSSPLPYTEEGRAARAALVSALQASGVANGFCEPMPPLHLMLVPDLRTIEVNDSSVVISYEAEGMYQRRIVDMDSTAHPADIVPVTEGHSIGRWEGDALVIDTVGQLPHRAGSFAVPSTASTRLVERLKLSQDRRQLEYTFTIEDPAYFTQPISYTASWDHRPDLEPSAVRCDPDNARRAVEQ